MKERQTIGEIIRQKEFVRLLQENYRALEERGLPQPYTARMQYLIDQETQTRTYEKIR